LVKFFRRLVESENSLKSQVTQFQSELEKIREEFGMSENSKKNLEAAVREKEEKLLKIQTEAKENSEKFLQQISELEQSLEKEKVSLEKIHKNFESEKKKIEEEKSQ
jgi:hypothetical protein